MLPTIEEILELPEVQRGRPRIVAGAAAIRNRVRWVHVSELLDIARFLRGGELLLTTGLTLPEESSELATYVRNLAAAELGGLVVELGRRYGELPTVMISVAEMENLPLIVLTREVPFVSVTEAVHSLIVDERLARLQFANEVHRTFQTLSMDGGSVKDVLREAATLLNTPVVFEGPGHQILAFESGGVRDPDLLDDWESRSRRAISTDRTAVVGPERWLYTSVGARGETWGRLIALIRTEPTEEQFMVAEWAATTLVVNRLVERDQASLDRLTHRNMLTELIGGNKANWFELRSRLQGAGIPTQDRRYIALSISRKPLQGKDIDDDADLDRELADSAAAAVNRAKLPNLVGSLRPNCVAMLVVLPAKCNRTTLLNELAKNIHEHASLRSNTQLVIGMGSVVNSLQEARRSIVEANQVADVASAMSVHKLFYEISDVRLRGLLHYLRNDSRVQDFVERELGPLVRHDRDSGGDLLGALTVFLDAGRNTSSAAAAYHLSRPAFYGRLKTIEKLLNVNLNTIDDCLSLHVALIAMKIMRDREIFTSAVNLS